MRNNLTNKDLRNLYTEYSDLVQEEKQLKENLKNIEKRKHQIETLFTREIPAGSNKAGIYHKVTYGKSISYGKVVTEARNLIPKTKHNQLDEIIEKHTKQPEKHRFIPAEEDQ